MFARTTPRNPETVGSAHCRFHTPHEDNRYDPARRASGSSPLQQPTHLGVSHVPVTPPHGRVTRPSPPPPHPAATLGAAVAAGKVHRSGKTCHAANCRRPTTGAPGTAGGRKMPGDGTWETLPAVCDRETSQRPRRTTTAVEERPEKAMRPKGKTSGAGTDAAAARRDGEDDRGQDECWRDGVTGGGTQMGGDALSSNKDCLAVDLHVPRCGQLEHISSKVRLDFGSFLSCGSVGTQLPHLQHQLHQWKRPK